MYDFSQKIGTAVGRIPVVKTVLYSICNGLIIHSVSIFLSCNSVSSIDDPGFQFHSTSEGIGLSENGSPVYFYQREPKSSNGEYICNNYLHPLYSLSGDTLTEEFPDDHPFHRGIYWSWHQVYADTSSIGDHWIMKDILTDVTHAQTQQTSDKAILQVKVNWRSPKFQDAQPFMEEETRITVHKNEKGYRLIDFDISLKALTAGIQLGGSDDAKGYGGFCTRLRFPDSILFTSAAGSVIPQELQVNAGPWMDITANFGGNRAFSGITILCHESTPNYPAPWILRKQSSMQNVVFPGRNRVDIPASEPVRLHYRLVIHNGLPDPAVLNDLQAAYNLETF